MRFGLVCSLLLTFFLNQYAYSSVKLIKTIDEKVLMALKKPSHRRIKLLKSMEADSAVAALETISNSKKLSLQTKWKAVVSAAQLYPKKSISFLTRTIRRSQWYYKNSALVALSISNKSLANKWALRLLKDSSLVVRTAAVKVISQSDHLNKESVKALKVALSDRINFRKNQSLWIRHHIVSALAKKVSKKDSHLFYKVLKDKDQRVKQSALRALDGFYPKIALKMKGLSKKQRLAKWIKYGDQDSVKLNRL